MPRKPKSTGVKPKTDPLKPKIGAAKPKPPRSPRKKTRERVDRCFCGEYELQPGDGAIWSSDTCTTHERLKCWPARKDALEKLRLAKTMIDDMIAWFDDKGGFDLTIRPFKVPPHLRTNRGRR
jgi:hypothetical protein